MRAVSFIVGLLSVASVAADNGKSGVFDFYVLEQSWQAEFCHGHFQDWPGCETPNSFDATSITLHGLWPQYATNQGGQAYPFNCPDTCKYPAELSADVVSSNIDDLNEYWPNVKDAPGVAGAQFWDHEWSKHGTCSGMSQSAYISAAISTLKTLGTPSIISDNVGKSVSVSDVVSAYGGDDMVLINCQGAYFSGTSTCWAFDPDTFAPTKQIACKNVVSSGQCTGDTINISAFPSSAADALNRKTVIKSIKSSRKMLH